MTFTFTKFPMVLDAGTKCWKVVEPGRNVEFVPTEDIDVALVESFGNGDFYQDAAGNQYFVPAKES